MEALFSVGAECRKKVTCPSRGMWLLQAMVGVSDFLAQNDAGVLSSEVSLQVFFFF